MAMAVNNNAFEIVPNPRNKRKISAPNPNVYMNPALDLLATNDAICNTTMEVSPSKRIKRSKSCGDSSSFENPCLDLKSNNVLASELWNVKHNMNSHHSTAAHLQNNMDNSTDSSNVPVNILQNCIVSVHNTINISSCDTFRERSNISSVNLSFLDRLGINTPDNSSVNSLYLDDDLNESNIMETKSIKTVFKVPDPDQHNFTSTNPFINCSSIEDPEVENETSINHSDKFPFNIPSEHIPYIDSSNISQTLVEDESGMCDFPIVPRRLFSDTTADSTISTIDTSMKNEPEIISNEESIEIPSILKNSTKDKLNKQSKILGCDVSMFKNSDIMNINKVGSTTDCALQNGSSHFSRSESLRSGKRSKRFLKPSLKVSNTLSKKVLKKIKGAFKQEKIEFSQSSINGNPYEVPRKVKQQKEKQAEVGFENPALSLDCSDIELEEIVMDNESSDGLNFSNVLKINKHGTPPRETMFQFKCNRENPLREISNLDINSNDGQPETPGKKHVRFDTTLNQEKIITGNSFDSFDSVQLEETLPITPCDDSVDLTMDKIHSELNDFHDELENCINEKKFLEQNL